MGLTQWQFGERLFLHRERVNRIEKGMQRAPGPLAILLAWLEWEV
jgi:hypothetical protein